MASSTDRLCDHDRHFRIDRQADRRQLGPFQESRLSDQLVRLVLASVIFAAFLFIFRALSWWYILRGLGHRLPIAPTVRIWSTSELARYLPGVIWQVVGRAYLAKPYGVSGSICSTSQVLELVIFLLANVLVAITSLLWDGTKHLHGVARGWMFCAMALVPILLLLLHPKGFYGVMNRILKKAGKPPIVQQLGFARWRVCCCGPCWG